MLADKNSIVSRQMELNKAVRLVLIGNIVLLVPNFRRGHINALIASLHRPQGPLDVLIEMKIDLFEYADFPDYLRLDQERTPRKKRNFTDLVISAVIALEEANRYGIKPPTLVDASRVIQQVWTIEEQYLRIQGAYLGITLCNPDQLAEKVRGHDGVIVEEEHIVGAAAESVTHTDIAARGKSQVGRIPYEPYLGGGFRELVC